jgi:uncharacterized SAM-binding protein YcdF (DUF218 family)
VPGPLFRSAQFRRLAAAAALAVAALVVVAFLQLGRFVAREDPLEHADAIFVFAGTLVERPLEAVDLFQSGYAPTIVLTRAIAEEALGHVERRGVRVPSALDLTRDIVRQLGVPDSAVIVPDRIHDNTGEEAATLRSLAANHGWKRVIVVSSKYHLRRVSIACRRALRGTGVELVMHGSRYDTSTPDRWWARRSDIRWLASEVPKLVAYVLGIGT